MTHDAIGRLLRTLNTGRVSNRAAITILSKRVAFAHIQLPESYTGSPDSSPYPFYLVTLGDDYYLGAVLDMIYDLHVYIEPRHRKKGHLCRALSTTILPHLYQRGRIVQKVSFDQTEVADYFVRRMAFKLTDPLKAEKDLSIYAGIPRIGFPGIAELDDALLDSEFDHCERCMRVVKRRLEETYGIVNDLAMRRLTTNMKVIFQNVSEIIRRQRIVVIHSILE